MKTICVTNILRHDGKNKGSDNMGDKSQKEMCIICEKNKKKQENRVFEMAYKKRLKTIK